MSAASLEHAAGLVIELTKTATGAVAAHHTITAGSFDGLGDTVTVAATACDVAPDDLWSHLADHHDTRAVLVVALGGPTDHLETLLRHRRLDIQHAVALNPMCPAALLDQMRFTHSWYMACRIATHPNTSEGTLGRIAAWAANPCALLTSHQRDVLNGSVERHPNWPAATIEP